MRNYNPHELEVLRKYRIILPAGTSVREHDTRRTLTTDEWRMVDLKLPENRPLGYGPLMDESAVDRLIAADTTPDQRWLDWIFHQAGGGDRLADMLPSAMKLLRERFMNSQINRPPRVTPEEAERRWEEQKTECEKILTVGNQDLLEKNIGFGYYRFWPGGPMFVYEQVVYAVTDFLAAYPQLLKMNAAQEKEGKPKLPDSPQTIKSVEQMVSITEQVYHYFGSLVARKEVRLSGNPHVNNGCIFDDDFIKVLVPLTWAAAVRYGHPNWSWANPDRFERTLTNPKAQDNTWQANTSAGTVYVCLRFKVATPRRLAANAEANPAAAQISSLNQLALELGTENVRAKSRTAGLHIAPFTDVDSLSVRDEADRVLTIGQVKAEILEEPTREEDLDDESPITRGANVYRTPEEAQEVVDHLNQALAAVQKWARTFNPKTIKQNALSRDEKPVKAGTTDDRNWPLPAGAKVVRASPSPAAEADAVLPPPTPEEAAEAEAGAKPEADSEPRP